MRIAWRRSRLITSLLLVFCSSISAASRVDGLNLAGYEGVQLQRGGQNHLVLQAKVNGHPANLVLDTGAERSFLQRDRATKFGVASDSSSPSAFIKGRSFPIGLIGNLRAGDVNLGNAQVALYDSTHLPRPVPGLGGKPADGIIGMDLLRRYSAVINCRTRQVYFKTDPSRKLSLVNATRGMGFDRVPLQQTARGYLMVPCTLRGKPGRLLVDTGAFVTILDEDAGVRFFGVRGSSSGIMASGFDRKTNPLKTAEIDDLKIGNVRVAPQRLLLMDMFGRKGRRPPSRMSTGMGPLQASVRWGLPKAPFLGLLGNELLDRHRAIIDLESMSLFLKRSD